VNDGVTITARDLVNDLRLPATGISTPCFVVLEDEVLHNLSRTAAACGGMHRLMPHVKTHRAPWIVSLLEERGVQTFKVATPEEVEMALAAGARYVVWAYPTVNPAHVHRLVGLARRFGEARLEAMIDSDLGAEIWSAQMADMPANIRLRVDLDPGLGRTGAPMSAQALALARTLHRLGRFAGWHLYDGHVKGDRGEREQQVVTLAKALSSLRESAEREGIRGDVIAGGSYTFNLWPESLARYVSPGSWTYSSDQHDKELADLGWRPAAFVLATVISTRPGTATLDAGCKAISPDKPMAERFRWPGRILLMNEEHTVVEAQNLKIGDRVLLMPRHACTTAYLYDQALVRTAGGHWENRPQLGGRR
jgi:D-serine deaminase-like pyridoxal phosphate-dependent protein